MKRSRAKKRRLWKWILGSKAAAETMVARLIGLRELRRGRSFLRRSS